VPKRLKLPPWRRWPPIPEPHPEWMIDFHLGFAAQLAVAAVDFAGTQLGESLDAAIERSVAAIDAIG
jgi:hypothetical protein